MATGLDGYKTYEWRDRMGTTHRTRAASTVWMPNHVHWIDHRGRIILAMHADRVVELHDLGADPGDGGDDGECAWCVTWSNRHPDVDDLPMGDSGHVVGCPHG